MGLEARGLEQRVVGENCPVLSFLSGLVSSIGVGPLSLLVAEAYLHGYVVPGHTVGPQRTGPWVSG